MPVATRGPVPKRSDERRRRNKSEDGPIATAPSGSKRFRRRPAGRNWHSVAKHLYDSMAKSGQAAFMEPSDWAFAYLVCHELSGYLTATKKSAVMFAALENATARLMITEGDRRRLRIELDREKPAAADPDGDAAVIVVEQWQTHLGAGAG